MSFIASKSSQRRIHEPLGIINNLKSMNSLEKKEMIKNLISQNKLSQAIVELAKIKDKDINSQTILISSRNSALTQSINTGVLNQDDIETERNQISNSLLYLANQINNDTRFNDVLDKQTVKNLSNLKSKFEFYTALIGLLTAISALSSAGYGIYMSLNNSEEIHKTQDRITEISNKFEIMTPMTGDTINNKDEIMGYYYKAIPNDKDLRVFIEDEGIYHPMKGIVELQSNNRWYFGPLILNFNYKKVNLLVCLVDKEIGTELDNRMSLGNPKANFKALEKIGPNQGIVPIARVQVFSE